MNPDYASCTISVFVTHSHRDKNSLHSARSHSRTYIQVLAGSLPNTGCIAIKPHFIMLHTIISDECYLELPLRSASTPQKATLSSFGKKSDGELLLMERLWRAICSGVTFHTHRLAFEKHLIVRARVFPMNHVF